MSAARQNGVRADAMRPIVSPTADDAVAESKNLTGTAVTKQQMIALLVGLLAVFAWSYWPVLVVMAEKWWTDPQFSHAMLVPPFALFLAWRNWNSAALTVGPACWWGLGLLLIGAGLRLVGARYFVDFFEAISIVPVIAGVVLLVFGGKVFRQTWPAIAFLIFMVPLPHRIETGLSLPLQKLATRGGTFVLQTMGLPAFAEGNVIVIGDTRVGVVEACNGLGMFLMFIAVSFGVAIMVRRPLWEKIVLVLSAIPIAVGVNIIRVVMTTLAYRFMSKELVDSVAHDFAGWLMMPMAILFLMLELKLLSKFFVEGDMESDRRPMSLDALRGNDTPRKAPPAKRKRP
jgi:exosortase